MGEARRRKAEIDMLKAMYRDDPMISILYDHGELDRGPDTISVRKSVVEKYRDEGVDAAISMGKRGALGLEDMEPEAKLVYEYTLMMCLVKMTANDNGLPEGVMGSFFNTTVEMTGDLQLAFRFAKVATQHMVSMPDTPVENPTYESDPEWMQTMMDPEGSMLRIMTTTTVEERREYTEEMIRYFESAVSPG